MGSRSYLVNLATGVDQPTDRLRAVGISALVARRDLLPPAPAPKRVINLDEASFEPVCGVSLELFADIAEAVAAGDDDSAHGAELAAQCGVAPEDWTVACRVWNARIAAHPAVAGHLMALFRSSESRDSHGRDRDRRTQAPELAS